MKDVEKSLCSFLIIFKVCGRRLPRACDVIDKRLCMRSRTIAKITVILISIILLASTVVLGASGETIVHVTKTGECYHTSKCSYLKSDIPITLSEAVKNGYRPCSKCNPPVLNSVGTVGAANSNAYTSSQNSNEQGVGSYVTNASKTSVKDSSSGMSPLVWMGIGAAGAYVFVKRKS